MGSDMWLEEREFKQAAREALELIPEEFRPYMENVEILVEDEASDALLDELEVPWDETLYGLYTGTPLTERHFESTALPDRITLYRLPLLDECEDMEELRREIAITLLHEVAHHFGIGEARLRELGWG